MPARTAEGGLGGCRCSARFGDAAATIRLPGSRDHDRVVSARESAQTDEFVYRTISGRAHLNRPASTAGDERSGNLVARDPSASRSVPG